MKENALQKKPAAGSPHPSAWVFPKEEVGLGDGIKRATSCFGIPLAGTLTGGRPHLTAGWFSPAIVELTLLTAQVSNQC